MNVLNEILNSLSSMLLMPVMLLLVAGFFVSGFLLYGVFHTALRRPALKRSLEKMKKRSDHNPGNTDLELRPRLKVAVHQVVQNSQPDHEQLLAEFECACEKESEMARILVRLGPMFGLMGTLIPMGPALTALASGDIAVMAHNLQIAFATTVIGIVVGGCGFIVQTFLQRWQAEEMIALEAFVQGGKAS